MGACPSIPNSKRCASEGMNYFSGENKGERRARQTELSLSADGERKKFS